jgi:hypothetical protein
MNAALGLLIEYPLQHETWSTNSSLLYVAAAKVLADLEEAVGGDAARWRTSGAQVWQAALDHLRLTDGCWAAYRFRDDFGGELSPGPYEDVALKEIWAGTTDGDDPDTQARLECLLDHTRQAPGILQTPLHSRYANPPLFPFVTEGMYTGMLPGYTLLALARAGHPEAEDAFDAVRLSADTAGNSTEYMVYDDHLPLHLIYVPSGTGATDYTARFRPWEGGIVLHALLDYVVGAQPQRDGLIVLRPHLPNGWPSFTANNVRVAGGRFDLTVRRVGPDSVSVDVLSHADEDLSFTIRWDHDDRLFTMDGDFEATGEPGDLGESVHMGARSTWNTTPFTLAPGGQMAIRFSPRP